MKVILALATLLAAVSAQTETELVWCDDTEHYLNRDGVVLDTFDGIVVDIDACKHLCDTDENGCNFVWFHEAERGLGTECKLIRDTYKWKPRSFANRGYTYNGRLCMPHDLLIPCEDNSDCYVALHQCNPELRHCEDRPTPEPTEATEEPTEATAEPTEVTEEPTSAPTEAMWCAPSENYLNHKGRPVKTVMGFANVEECMAGCDTYEGCNMVWFYTDLNKCRYFEGAEKLKAKSRTDTRVHITYTGRLCGVDHDMHHCTEDYHCYYLDHCNKDTGYCVDGAPVESVETEAVAMKMLASPVTEIGRIQLLFAAVGVAAVLYGSYVQMKKCFRRGIYAPVPAPIDSEEV